MKTTGGLGNYNKWPLYKPHEPCVSCRWFVYCFFLIGPAIFGWLEVVRIMIGGNR